MLRSVLLAVLLACSGPSGAQAHGDLAQPKQGLVDLLLEYLATRYRSQDLDGDLLYVSVQRQRLFHVRQRSLVAEFPIATASNGLGAEMDSYRTPTGLHVVSEKFGDGVPPLGILKDREFTGDFPDEFPDSPNRDWITSRIFWLSGLEPGVNQGGAVDSHERFIYIHGTANEASVGTPSSWGCIRMRNMDIIALYEQVPIGALVVVLDN